ncbi:MAG: L,D-transpeptidase family protein [Velocimicrobium sp.]
MTQQRKLLLRILFPSLLIVLIGYLSIAFYYHTHFFSGSFINNIDYSGKTVKEIESNIADEMSTYTLTIEGRNELTDTISASDIKFHYVSEGQVQTLKDQQNEFLWPFSFFTQQQSQMQVRCEYNESLLIKCRDNLVFFKDNITTKPLNAEILYGDDGFYIHPETLGTTLNKETVLSALKDAIKACASSLSLENASCYISPSVLSSDESIQTALDVLRKYTDLTITYDFGDRTEVLDRSLLKDWVRIDENFQVTLDKQKVIDYVNFLGYYYTTFSSTRDFVRYDGKAIQVKGGDYGWIINRTEEVEQLYQLILDGKSMTREPVYSQFALSRDKNDIGNTYIEINLKKQHLWLFVDGKKIMDSKVVTGNISKDYATPSGIYAITYKERNATLVGQNYNSPVNYWMPFNKNIGFHDASWRDKFGGKIYKKKGSHGCVNMPPKKAKKLYESIQKGTPVVIY